jgi:hypothetical protein
MKGFIAYEKKKMRFEQVHYYYYINKPKLCRRKYKHIMHLLMKPKLHPKLIQCFHFYSSQFEITFEPCMMYYIPPKPLIQYGRFD